MKIQYGLFFFLIFERLGLMHKNKPFFFKKNKILQHFKENHVF